MDEFIVSGYCRQLDATRMVLCEEGEADCAYPDCPYEAECQIAAAIRERLQSGGAL